MASLRCPAARPLCRRVAAASAWTIARLSAAAIMCESTTPNMASGARAGGGGGDTAQLPTVLFPI
eukprot:3779123-Pleurochrysis_carterae.AAC.1